jgi:hypothetical protein
MWLAVLLLVPLAIVVAMIGIGGDFPLSDDWSYAHTAKVMCEQGRVEILPWTGATAIFQTAYGALLCKLTGFSFVTLRVSTLLMALLAILGFLRLLSALGISGQLMALATLTMALNPLMVNLSFTYMTDVPFTALLVWAAYWYHRGLGTGRPGHILAGSLLASAAILVRQHSLLLALAAAVAALWVSNRSLRQRFVLALLALLPPTAVLASFNLWLLATERVPQGLANKLSEALAWQWTATAANAFRGLVYVGLFLAPVVLAALRNGGRRVRRTAAAIAALLSAVAVYAYWREGALMPYLGNVAYDLGLGALTLRDALFLGMGAPLRVGAVLQVPLTIVALLGAAAVVAMLAVRTKNLRTADSIFLVLGSLFMFAGTLVHADFYFDRYLLPVLPLGLLALCAAAPRTRPQSTAWILAGALAVYAVAGTHDYMSWNRARYQALDRVMAGGVEVTSIDGGMDFNGWHLSQTVDRWPDKESARPGQPATRKSWWWVVDDLYVTSFRPLPGYRVHERADFDRWLPPGTGSVFILERIKAD